MHDYNYYRPQSYNKCCTLENSGHLEFPTCIKQNHSKGKCNYHLTNVYSWVQFAKKHKKIQIRYPLFDEKNGNSNILWLCIFLKMNLQRNSVKKHQKQVNNKGSTYKKLKAPSWTPWCLLFGNK